MKKLVNECMERIDSIYVDGRRISEARNCDYHFNERLSFALSASMQRFYLHLQALDTHNSARIKDEILETVNYTLEVAVSLRFDAGDHLINAMRDFQQETTGRICNSYDTFIETCSSAVQVTPPDEDRMRDELFRSSWGIFPSPGKKIAPLK